MTQDVKARGSGTWGLVQVSVLWGFKPSSADPSMLLEASFCGQDGGVGCKKGWHSSHFLSVFRSEVMIVFFSFQLANVGHLGNRPRKPCVKIKHFNPPLLTDYMVVIIRLLGAEVQCLINVIF